jgi:hypothetical protein
MLPEIALMPSGIEMGKVMSTGSSPPACTGHGKAVSRHQMTGWITIKQGDVLAIIAIHGF